MQVASKKLLKCLNILIKKLKENMANTISMSEKKLNDGKTEIIIQSTTRDGKAFRPSDWIDRICSTFATFGENRKLRYSPYLKPEVISGVRCLVVDMKLQEVSPERFEELMQFANENKLNVLDESGNSIEVPLNS
jgi:hypothetical protein